MKLVVDTNRVIAALIKDGVSRRILADPSFDFYSPDHTLSEIHAYAGMIRGKAKVSAEELEILLSLLFERITILPREEYEGFLEQAENMISDVDDVPFLAASMATMCDGIWSDDRHFLEQNKIRVLTTADMLKLM